MRLPLLQCCILLLCMASFEAPCGDDAVLRWRLIFPDGQLPYTNAVATVKRYPHVVLQGNVSVAPSGALQFDGKSGYLHFPGTSDLDLRRGATLSALVKFDLEATCGALFYRHNELLAGRNQLGQFYCNFADAKAGGKMPMLGEFVFLSTVLEPEKEGKTVIQLFVNAKLVHRGQLDSIRAAPAEQSDLEFGRAPDRGGDWFFHGEVAGLAVHQRALGEAELQLELNWMIGRDLLYEPLHGNSGMAVRKGTSCIAAENRKSRSSRALLLRDTSLEWALAVKGAWFVEIMFKASQPELLKPFDLLALEIAGRRFSAGKPADLDELRLSAENFSELRFPLYHLRSQLWMTHDAMWHHLAVFCQDGKLKWALDGFFAPGAIECGQGTLNRIQVGGAGQTAFSDLRLVQGTLGDDELRARYRVLYQFDDGRAWFQTLEPGMIQYGK